MSTILSLNNLDVQLRTFFVLSVFFSSPIIYPAGVSISRITGFCGLVCPLFFAQKTKKKRF